MKEYRYRVQFICNYAVKEIGYYQLVRISDDAILVAKKSYSAMVVELEDRDIDDVTFFE